MTENQTPSFKLYSLAEITIGTYFGGPLVAGWFARQNYINLGKKDAGTGALIIGIVSTILVIVGIFAIPQNIFDKIPSPLIPAIYTGIIYFFIKNLQGEEIEEHKKNRGDFYSVWTVVGISFVCTIICAAMFFGYAYLLPGSNDGEKSNKGAAKEVNELIYVDTNTYKSVQIGTQIWMSENLKNTRYNDGTEIPLKTSNNDWIYTRSGAYCFYDNDSTNMSTYGALYNRYAVNTGKLCPAGWHVPSDEEWTTLTEYLGGESVAGGKLKEKGTSHWLSPNKSATNKSGFTAVAGGMRDFDGKFNYLGTTGMWWIFADFNSFPVDIRALYNDESGLSSLNYYYAPESGLSVRCIKN